MSNVHTLMPNALACVLALAMASAASAQAPRTSSNTSASAGMTEFTDPRTGEVWTIGHDSQPVAGPDDATFDPKAQNAPLKTYDQTVRGKPIAKVPLAAGARIAEVTMDDALLRAVPGQRWQVVLYLDNNTANPVNPVVECHFSKGGKPIWNTRVFVQEIGVGLREGLVVYGPKPDVSVDQVSCRVTAP
jgi:hypothetical protein